MHAFDTLEARVVLDGDELPIAEFPTIDVRIRSDEQAAIVNTAIYTSLAGGYDPDGGNVSIVGGNSPMRNATSARNTTKWPPRRRWP